MKPVIGITAHVEGYEKGQVYFSLLGQYVLAVKEFGGVPLILPPHLEYAAEPEEVLVSLHGLVLSGGGGNRNKLVPPGSNPSLRSTNPPRYDYEVRLVLSAIERKLPLLAICRGFQTLVEAMGGHIVTLGQSSPNNVRHDQEELPGIATHKINIQPGTRLYRYLGPVTWVNSLHRQGFWGQVPGLVAVAWAEDGLVEAVEGENDEEFLVGVQFHPEWLYGKDVSFAKIFQELMEASRVFSKMST